MTLSQLQLVALTRLTRMRRIVPRFTPASKHSSDSAKPMLTSLDATTTLNVLLTGSTGTLGSYLLDELLSQPQVTKVFCLNRSADAKNRQRNAHCTRALTETLPEERVEFIQADFDDKTLGLPIDRYRELASAVDVIVHNAWPVDFNRNLTSFKPSVNGVTHLINFCTYRLQPLAIKLTISLAEREKAVKFIFISSIGATSNWGSAAPSSRSEVPEAELTDWKVARTGYGQSKLLSERLLAHAAATLSVPVAIIRVGQLAGPVSHGLNGKWTEREWVPSIIRSSITLRALPETLGPTETVDWVPIDIAAQILIELSMQFSHLPASDLQAKKKHKHLKALFYHVVNPQQARWSDLTPVIKIHIPSNVRTVPFIEWVDLLKKSAEAAGGFQGVDEGVNPAAKLIDFFDNLQDKAIRFPHARTAELETKNTADVSNTLSCLEAVNKDWMGMWMRQWSWTSEAHCGT